MRRARLILGLAAAAALAIYLAKGAIRNHDLYGNIGSAEDAVFIVVACLPYVLLALLPRREGSTRMETIRLVLLLVALILLGATIYFVETSLSSTAGLGLLWAGVGAWICLGLGSAFAERERNRSGVVPPPPRAD